MGRLSRRALRHDLLRGIADAGCQQAEGRLSLRRPVSGLLPGGCQSTPLSRRSTRRPRAQEEARRRAEARLANLFRTDGDSPGRRRRSARRQLGCVAVEDGSDSDGLLSVSGGAAAPVSRPPAVSTTRPLSQTSGGGSTQSGGGEGHRSRSAVRSGDSRHHFSGRDDVQYGSGARDASPRNAAAEVSTRCPSVAAPGSEQGSGAHAAAASGAGCAAGGSGGDWTAPRQPISASALLPTTPDEGEGLTPGPGGGVRIEDLLDTVLGEVQAQLEQLTAGRALLCDEERAGLVALYGRQPPAPPGGDCPLLQRLSGEDADTTETADGGSERVGGTDSGAAKSDSQCQRGDTEEDNFVLQVCTSSQEDSALEQDPIRFLKMVEAANTGAASVSGDSGTGWLDAPQPQRGAPLRQCDFLAVRTGAVPRAPPAATEVGWLEAAVSPGRWPDWRGGGDILDVLDQ